MGRHKTTPHTDEERAELYEKYIRPNHKLVRKNVARFTSKKSEIKDNFQDIETHLKNIGESFSLIGEIV